MIEELQRIAGEAETRLAEVTDLDTLAELDRALLGRKSAVTLAKKRLGGHDPEDRKVAGRTVNEVRGRIEAALADARDRLSRAARAEQLEVERLDLTELRPEIRRGALHPVTQARDHLEDVFVGMGFTVAEGPEVESAWYNFEALNIPEWHPARGSFDTIFVNLGEPEEVMLRSHTSPVQIRTMENS
jgi:phenylalanyl-tRNA synthetase alpha chain